MQCAPQQNSVRTQGSKFCLHKPSQPDVLHKYNLSDLRYDIDHGYVRLKEFKPQDGLSNAQRKQQDSAFNAEILENSNSLAFMHTGADLLNEHEADNSPFGIRVIYIYGRSHIYPYLLRTRHLFRLQNRSERFDIICGRD